MPLRLFQIDAFTDRPFAGNPAAVCLLDAPASEGWMQDVAAETAMPATAFVAPGDGSGADRSLRWFAGRTELALCGHGTLAASHVLLHEVGAASDEIRYATGAGTLTARSGEGGLIELGLPAHRPVAAPEAAAAAAAALWADGGAPAVETWRGFQDLLVAVPSVDDVLGLAVDAPAVTALGARCVIVTGPGDDGGRDTSRRPLPPAADFVSRVFASPGGLTEDSVTGSAHCLLGPFWAERLGRPVLQARQASARGGDLRVEVRGDRVLLAGRAVTVLRAELAVADPVSRGARP
jgi:PhzF family phenazine biosynthesis protein